MPLMRDRNALYALCMELNEGTLADLAVTELLEDMMVRRRRKERMECRVSNEL